MLCGTWRSYAGQCTPGNSGEMRCRGGFECRGCWCPLGEGSAMSGRYLIRMERIFAKPVVQFGLCDS